MSTLMPVPAETPPPQPQVADRRFGSLAFPEPPTPLLGRESELDALHQSLAQADTRLLTLIGPGGVGKTRLALRTASLVAGYFPKGVFLAELATLRDPSLVLPTIAQSLQLPGAGTGSLAERIKRFFGVERALLVLDNVEQVVDAAPALATILAGCPLLTILATSRVPLRLYGERLMPVPPLAVQESAGSEISPVGDLSPALLLFQQRAQAVYPSFSLSPANIGPVMEICRRLDGLPLAIELAAGRVSVLTPDTLLARLDRRLSVLAGGPRDRPDRQRTMAAAIEWSYELLSPALQILFQRLSVFSGGFSLEAAEAVAGAGLPSTHFEAIDVLDGVSALVECNLLGRQDTVGENDSPRFAMLETIREYGLERLAEGDEADAVRARHLDWCVELAERAESFYLCRDEPAWFERLALDHDNFRAALAWAIHGDSRAIHQALRLTGALWRFWQTRGYLREGRRWIAAAMARDTGPATPARAKALSVAGNLAWIQKDNDAATAFHEESLRIWDGLSDSAGVARALFMLGLVATQDGDLDRLSEIVDRATPLVEALDEGHWVVPASWVNEGLVAYYRGEPERANSLLKRARANYQSNGFEWGIAWLTGHLAEFAADRHDAPEAVRLRQESLRLYWNHGDRWGVVEAMTEIASLAADTAQAMSAARLFGAADALRESIGIPVTPAFLAGHQRGEAAARSALGDSAFDVARDQGRAMPLRDAVAEAGSLSLDAAPCLDQVGDEAALAGLTRREIDVLRLLAEGKSNRMIADELFISPRTVGVHLSSIFDKLDVHSRAGAVAWFHRLGLG
ncbi:MAG TPA: LuxR C-terminal-related transcriptional regulator [Thermomicrobiales bacterium]|nr:LuxR C-terminal-related transcriptional regulator [Thermomicrobiales bacterium]